MNSQHVQVEELSPVEKKLQVEIPWDRVRQKLDHAYKELGKGATLRGFRKGKVPRSVLERVYGKQVQLEVAKELVQESFIQAAEEHKLEPVAEPIVEDATIKSGEAFRYSARIEIRAPIDLRQIDGLPGKRRKIVVTDAEVEQALEQKRREHTEFKPIEGRTTSAPTDVLVVSVKGKIGEHDVDRPEIMVDLTDPAVDPLPGLASALTGVALDAKDLQIELDVPADHPQKEVAGAHASLAITVKDAREKLTPALDDDFAKDTGEADTLDELRAKIRQGIEAQKGQAADREMKETVLKALIDANPVPVAPALVERAIDNQLQRTRMQLAMQGIDLAKAGVDVRQLRERLRDGAAAEVRGQLLLEEIADREKIEVSEAEVDAKIAELAEARQRPAGKLKAELARDGSLDSLRWRLRQDRALDLVASRATITELEESDEAASEGGAEPASSPAPDAPVGEEK